MHNVATLLLEIAGSALLLSAALHDFAFRTVPNAISAALLVCGVVLRVLDGYFGWGLVAGPAVFILTALIWRFGGMGGGDVKLLTAAAVFVPPALVFSLVAITSVAGGLLALVYLVGGRVAPRPAAVKPPGLVRRAARCELWRLHRRGPLPYAAAIATGALVVTFAS